MRLGPGSGGGYGALRSALWCRKAMSVSGKYVLNVNGGLVDGWPRLTAFGMAKNELRIDGRNPTT